MSSLAVTPYHYLVLSALIFVIGVVGVVIRRNILVILMSIELMLNASNIALVALSWLYSKPDGAVMALFVIVIAAIEAAIGLAIAVNLFRRQGTVDLADLRTLRG